MILGAILSTAFYGLYKKVLKLFKGRDVVASLFSVFLVLIIIVVPLSVFIFLLGRQAVDTVLFIQHNVQSGIWDNYLRFEPGTSLYDGYNFVRDYLRPFVDIGSIDLKSSLLDMSKWFASFVASQGALIVKSFGWLLISVFVLGFSMFYFFKDADFIIKKIMLLSPLPDSHERELLAKFKEISFATLYGIFLTAVVQGILGGIGFFVVGIPNALFWGTAVSVFSLVPLIGTSTVWFPASVILLLSGNLVGGVMLFLWGLLVVSTVDNFLRAYLIGERANMNQLLMFLAVFGGIMAFGLIGIIFGPLILTLFFGFLHIYENEYEEVLHSDVE